MSAPRTNPYQLIGDGSWWWYDEDAHAHGPYETQPQALYAVLQHMDPTAKKRATHEAGWNLVFFVTGAVIVALAWWLS